MSKHHKRATSANPGPSTTAVATEAPVASADKDQDNNGVVQEDIRLHAYQKWEAAGKPNGDGMQFWLEAEQELTEAK